MASVFRVFLHHKSSIVEYQIVGVVDSTDSGFWVDEIVVGFRVVRVVDLVVRGVVVLVVREVVVRVVFDVVGLDSVV